jgi:hypothetical protein
MFVGTIIAAAVFVLVRWIVVTILRGA